jgi:hypothetical protein
LVYEAEMSLGFLTPAFLASSRSSEADVSLPGFFVNWPSSTDAGAVSLCGPSSAMSEPPPPDVRK